MKFSDEELEKFRCHLMDFRCPQCGGQDIRAFSDRYQMMSLTPEFRFDVRFVSGDFTTYDLFMVSCARCGMVFFFDPAIILGRRDGHTGIPGKD